MRIGILDTDRQQRVLLIESLQEASYECEDFLHRDAALAALRKPSVDLLILHWTTDADQDPASTLRAIREAGVKIPLLVVTAQSPEDTLIPLLAERMADYLLKPVRRGELLTRVRVLLKRAHPSKLADELVRFDKFVFEPRTARVTVDDRSVRLTQKEFRLALLFFHHLGRPLSRAFILESVWPEDTELSSRTMDTHVSRVRNKLGLQPDKGFRLAPVYSYGYRLEKLAE